MASRRIPKERKEMALAMSFQGLPDSEIHEHTGISIPSIKRLRSIRRKQIEEASRKPIAPSRPCALTSMHRQFLCDFVERRPDSALKELQTDLVDVCGIQASVQTVARTLEMEGYTMKTITRPVLERNERDRADFKALINIEYHPEQLVFADESYFNQLTTTRPYAWSKRGERARRYEFQFRGSKYPILPAISIDGVVHLEVLTNAVTRTDFHRFVEGLLPHMNEWPLPNSVLVIDNASIHKVPDIRAMVEERGARLLYLPSHSPDFNPIELALSPIKAWLHANQGQEDQERMAESTVYTTLKQAVHSVCAENAWEWYKHCGYIHNN